MNLGAYPKMKSGKMKLTINLALNCNRCPLLFSSIKFQLQRHE